MTRRITDFLRYVRAEHKSQRSNRVIGSYCYRGSRTCHYFQYFLNYLHTSKRSLSRYIRAKRERSLGN